MSSYRKGSSETERDAKALRSPARAGRTFGFGSFSQRFSGGWLDRLGSSNRVVRAGIPGVWAGHGGSSDRAWQRGFFGIQAFWAGRPSGEWFRKASGCAARYNAKTASEHLTPFPIFSVESIACCHGKKGGSLAVSNRAPPSVYALPRPCTCARMHTRQAGSDQLDIERIFSRAATFAALE